MTVEERLEILESALSSLQNLITRMDHLERDLAKLREDSSNPFLSVAERSVSHTTGYKAENDE